MDVLSFATIPPVMRLFMLGDLSFLLNKVEKREWHALEYESIEKRCLHSLIEKNKQQNYDIINAQDPYSTLAALETGLPVVSTVHGYLAFEAVSKGSVIEGSPEAKKLKAIEIEAYQGLEKLLRLISGLKTMLRKYQVLKLLQFVTLLIFIALCLIKRKRMYCVNNMAFQKMSILYSCQED